MVQSMKHKRVVFFSFYIIDVKIKTGHFSYNEIPPVCKLTAPFPSSSSLKVVLSIKRVTHPSQKNLLCLLDYIFCAYQNLMIANFCILTTETRDVMGPLGHCFFIKTTQRNTRSGFMSSLPFTHSGIYYLNKMCKLGQNNYKIW